MSSTVPRQLRAYRSQLRVFEAALEIVRSQGWEALQMKDVARAASVSVGLVCRYFPTRDHFALALYGQLADSLLDRAPELPAGTVMQRFATILRWKLELLAPHRTVLTALASVAIDPKARAGVLSDASAIIRAKVAGLFDLAVRGAQDAPPREHAARLGRLLYGLHLFAVLLWIQLPEGEQLPLGLLEGSGGLLGGALAALSLSVDPTLRALLGEVTPSDPETAAAAILGFIGRRKRELPSAERAPGEPDGAGSLFVRLVQAMIDRGRPIELVLPAFPAKAPNREKVLGKAPDMAEWLALESLSGLLDEIEAVYPPGAELIICSDGGVFADLVGVSDADVRAYRAALEQMSARIDARIRIFDLDDAFPARTTSLNRRTLMSRYGSSMEELRRRASQSPPLSRMIDGIHRLVFEDEIVRFPQVSRTQARKRTRERAHEVVLRSEAWGALVGAAFPAALRLSIHPQPVNSSKLGIHLIDTDDAWLTPWHGVAVLAGSRFKLMRRREAEAMGAVPQESEDGLAYLAVPA